MFGRSKDKQTAVDKVEELYNKYSKLMRAEAFRILRDYALSEDAVHQAFIKIMKSKDTLDYSVEAKIRNYLVIVVRSISMDIYKNRTYLNNNSEAINYEIDDNDNYVDYNSEPSQVLIDKENIDRVSKIIESMPPIYRDVILLEKLYLYSKDEIAKLLGINYETVRKRSLRAKKMLVEALEKEDMK